MLVLRGHEDVVRYLCYSPDGRYLASGSEDKTARLWDLANGGSQTASCEHGSSIEAIAFSPDGTTLLVGTDEGDLRKWVVALNQQGPDSVAEKKPAAQSENRPRRPFLWAGSALTMARGAP